MGVLEDAAAAAPTTPGVYFFLDGRETLLYIGKATNIRTRLRQHAKAAGDRAQPRSVWRGGAVQEVRWETWPTEADAAHREADLIAVYRPSMNAALTTVATWVYVVVQAEGERTSFRLQPEAGGKGARTYGCFPHLGVGQASVAGIACSEGYPALLRLLWAAGTEGDRYPAVIARPSPPTAATFVVDARWASGLHRALSGSSDRVIRELASAAEHRPAFMQPALRRDAIAAKGFFDTAPRWQREIRLRHGLAAGPLTREDFERLVHEEVVAAIGPFRPGRLADPSGGIVGRRRGRAMALRAKHRTPFNY